MGPSYPSYCPVTAETAGDRGRLDDAAVMLGQARLWQTRYGRFEGCVAEVQMARWATHRLPRASVEIRVALSTTTRKPRPGTAERLTGVRQLPLLCLSESRLLQARRARQVCEFAR